MKTAVLHDSAFCAYKTLRAFAEEHRLESNPTGALASFCGIARAQGQRTGLLHSLHLDCYPSMAVQCLEDIVEEARRRWSVQAATIHHRIGEIPVSETIVLVASLSARRFDAFESCRYMTDMVKVRPPLWKREHGVSGERAWIDATAEDTRCAERWRETRARHAS